MHVKTTNLGGSDFESALFTTSVNSVHFTVAIFAYFITCKLNYSKHVMQKETPRGYGCICYWSQIGIKTTVLYFLHVHSANA